MLDIDIPGKGRLKIKNVIFDFNGTIAVDGKIDKKAKKFLLKLKKFVNVYILTADTYGNVKKQCEKIGVNLMVFSKEGSSLFKKEIVENLKGGKVAVGNGFNDIEMFKVCDLSIAIIGKEGCSCKLLNHADIVVKSIEDIFGLLFNSLRVKATLRK